MWFDPAFITKSKSSPLATSATSATFQPASDCDLPESRKAAKVATPQVSENCSPDVEVERWRVKVESMLEGGRKYAVVAGNPADDPVVVSVAIRDLGSFQIEIPKQFYDPFVLLELVEKHTTEGAPS